ncbi:protein arginine N-methyltransferase 6-like [Pristis pectinata]|uniref:protein arginine N-methyltransferase 6-like n=1 Tax=Pristis pectinata TaxID=685728 RepID=UPI00223D5C7D|nr:protein arginine N-methyltransferase 6-like [Pristis pectinata]XP_051891254.1 protein arginine N-methyltransferase 6-like [Pristis pectinata]XP_051891255.1 protein arginine N-methyltransferase 6-like [Pristis pectinata]
MSGCAGHRAASTGARCWRAAGRGQAMPDPEPPGQPGVGPRPGTWLPAGRRFPSLRRGVGQGGGRPLGRRMQPESPGRHSIMEPGCNPPPGKRPRLDAQAREESAAEPEARETSATGAGAREGPEAEAREKPVADPEARERQDDTEAREGPEVEARERQGPEAEARERQDGAYFHSYSDVSIHEEMIADAARTGSYRRALQRGCGRGPGGGALLRGLTVLDVGAGTGILSVFCAQAGAARVYACEACAVMAERAREVVAANRLGARVHVVPGRVEEARLPGRVDAIVSEWMGYGLMYESMLRSVLHARDRWLRPGGLLFPCRAQLYLAPVTDPALQERLSFWAGVKERHGVDMACMAAFARRCLMNDEMAVGALHGEDVLGRPAMFAAIDLYTVTERELGELGGCFTTTSFGTATMHAFALWFDVIFPTGAPARGVGRAPPANGTIDLSATHANAYGPNAEGPGGPGPQAPSVNADDHTGTTANDDRPASDPSPHAVSAHVVSANTSSHNAFTTNSDNLHSFNINGDDHKTVDVNVDDLEPVVLSTSPFAEETHWKQSILYLDEPVEVFQDTVLKGKITLTPAEDNPRYLRISLTYEIGDSGKKTKIFKMGEDFPPFE